MWPRSVPTTSSTCSASRSARPGSSARCSATTRCSTCSRTSGPAPRKRPAPEPPRPLHDQKPGTLQVSPAGLTAGAATPSTLTSPPWPRDPIASPSLTGAPNPMPKSYADLLREARAQIREVTPQDVVALPADVATVIDVREDSEWEQGHLPGARHISKSYIEQQIEGAVPNRDAPVVLYCAGGVRSLFAAQTLAEMGYTNVASMSG